MYSHKMVKSVSLYVYQNLARDTNEEWRTPFSFGKFHSSLEMLQYKDKFCLATNKYIVHNVIQLKISSF